MATLDSDLRRQLERTVINARKSAEEAADKALKRLGMDQNEPPKTLSPEELGFRKELEAQKTQIAGYQALKEQCAYEHWHRILFARFLAENELLIHPTARVAVSLEDCNDEQLQKEFGASDAYDLAARYASQMLPAIFRPDDALLRVKFAPEDRLKLEVLVESLPDPVFRADDSLGWTYQFWQKERKEEVRRLKKAVQGNDISAVTQLFTEHYMVRFLLENTLGAWWVHHQPETGLKNGWEYFKPDIPHDFQGFPEKLQEITFIDPCCGSGHFLVEAFLLLQGMYYEQGMTLADAGDAALANNVYGLELDPRCTQIAAFNLAFAAWRYGGFRRLPDIQVACSGLPLNGERSTWERLAGQDEALRAGMILLYDTFSNASDLGSLIHPPRAFDVQTHAQGRQFTFEGMHESERQQQLDLAASVNWEDLEPLLKKALDVGENRDAYFAGVRAQGIAKSAQMLSNRYWFAVTNPPFLNMTKAGSQLQEFCNQHHSDAKKDLATCFLERLRNFTKTNGQYALVCPQNWLFLGTDEELRIKLLNEQRWLAVIRFGSGAFETINGEVMQAANVIFSNRVPTSQDAFFGLNASGPEGAANKASFLRTAGIATIKTGDDYD